MSKATKHRPCEATQRVISAAECGQNRISRYNCPANCPFNPFSPTQYDSFEEIEARLLSKTLDRFVNESPDRVRTLTQLTQLLDRSEIEFSHYQIQEIYFKRDAQGRTWAERWAAAGFPTLNNDEQVLQRAFMRIRLGLIEVHRILDDTRIEAVDLLEPEPRELMICDRDLAAKSCRFSTLLCWLAPLPHFCRVFGFVLYVPAIGFLEPPQVVEEIVRHLGGPTARDCWSEWFAHNLVKFGTAVDAVSLAQMEQVFRCIDSESRSATYELRAPFGDCRRTLDSVEAVALDELVDAERNEGFLEARLWYDSSDDVYAEPSRPVLGRVLLGRECWRLETVGHKKLEQLKAEFERTLGNMVKFRLESQGDLIAQLKLKELNYDRALVPPRLLEELGKLLVPVDSVMGLPDATDSSSSASAHTASGHDRAWLDKPVLALDGKTPRQAASDPVLRARLIRLLKNRVRRCDERNLETGGSEDINWLLKELGADEIIFDPPPPRVNPGKDNTEAKNNPTKTIRKLNAWPPLPPRPFTEEEAIERVKLSMDACQSTEEARNAMMAGGGRSLIEGLRYVVGNTFTTEEYALVDLFVMHVWTVFVPPGCYGPLIKPEDFPSTFVQQLELVKMASISSESDVDFFFEKGAQPHLLLVFAAMFKKAWDAFLPRPREKQNKFTLMLLILKATIDLLDAKCRTSQP